MLRNKSKIAIGTGLLLILFGVILGSFINVQGPSNVGTQDQLRFRNNLILIQIGKNGEGISGVEKTVPDWENSHRVNSFSYGVQGPIGSQTEFATAGKPSFLEMAIVRESNAATPLFFSNILTATVFSSVKMAGFGQHNGFQTIDWQIYLEGVVFTSMAVIGIEDPTQSGNNGNLESITLRYQQITVVHTALDGQGGTSTVSECWNLVKNSNC